MAVSPSGKEVAFVLRGDVYVTSVEYKTTKRITNTPAQERNVSFSEDGRTLVYDSERDGLWQLFTTTIKNPDEKSFAYATDLEEKLLYKGDKAAQQPEYSPDGKHVAFLRDRTELCVIDPATGKVTTALDGKYNYSYSDGDITFCWSPDSRWLLINYIGTGGWNNTDIAMVAAVRPYRRLTGGRPHRERILRRQPTLGTRRRGHHMGERPLRHAQPRQLGHTERRDVHGSHTRGKR